MRLWIDAACGCNMGKIRRNNEDNFLFGDQYLEPENQGLENTAIFSDVLKSGLCLAVFDGMGGEEFGEVASFAAARRMQAITRSFSDYFAPERKYLEKLTAHLNDAVVEAREELGSDRCGSTMAALYFASGYAYSCNIGDSRTYRLRDGVFQQLSVDHIEKRPAGKAPLTQYLGIDPMEMQLEPYIAKGRVERGDVYLLCSDGLTDMLTNFTIADILLNNPSPEKSVESLIRAALEQGGRDNITAIVSKIR